MSVNGKNKVQFLSNLTTHEPLFRQGHVGDLQSKSKVEIEELLQRQEKLLSNRKFISRLPDKGAKIESFASALRQRLDELNNEESFDAVEIECNTSNRTQEDRSQSAINLQTTDQSSGESNVDLSIIEKGFTDLAIHEGPHYEVVKKAAEKPKQSKFKLNRLKESRETKPSPVDAGLTSPKALASPMMAESGPSHQDMSAASIRDPKNPSKIISIEECRHLYTKQQAVLKEQQSQLAVERVMSKYTQSVDEIVSDSDDEDGGSSGHANDEAAHSDFDDVD